MLTKQCIPFYLDNNSSNLPFYLLKDSNENDVIYINDQNMIYTNEKKLQINEQLNLYEKCLNQGICYSYKINDELFVLKKKIDDSICWCLLVKNEELNMYETNSSSFENIKIHFNDKYFCLTSREYGEYIPSIVAGYDINENKLLDCNDYKTENSLYKYLVEVRRCQFDCICSILSDEILLEDEERLFYFLSFILDKRVDQTNYKSVVSIVKNYILEKYPTLSQINISLNNGDLKEQNKLFDINYFCFNRLNKKLDDLKYLNNKTYVKA